MLIEMEHPTVASWGVCGGRCEEWRGLRSTVQIGSYRVAMGM